MRGNSHSRPPLINADQSTASTPINFEKTTTNSSFESINSTTILPPSSIRDIVALVFILLSLPQFISCIILTTYILSGSSKFIGGKFVAKHLLRGANIDVSYDHFSINSNYKSKLIGFSLQIFSINSIILLIFYYFSPKNWLQYLVVLAKSIIASELIGFSSSTSSTITSITSTNPSGGVTTTTTINQNSPNSSIPNPNQNPNPNKKINSKRQYENKYFSNHFLNSIICFIFVISINYLIQDWILLIDFKQVKVLLRDLFSILQTYLLEPSQLHNNEKYNQFVNSINDMNDNDNIYSSDLNLNQGFFSKLTSSRSPFLITSQIFSNNNRNFNHHYMSKNYYYNTLSYHFVNKFIIYTAIHYFNLNETSIQKLSLILRRCSIILNYFYLVLCIHVVILTISPILNRIILLKDYSRTLDHLSSLTPMVPLEFKRMIPPPPSVLANENGDQVIINVEPPFSHLSASPYLEKLTNELNEVNLDDSISLSSIPESNSNKISSTAAKNFETFCLTPFTNKAANCLNFKSSNFSKVDSYVEYDTKKIPVNPTTTIVDNNVLRVFSVQPFWSLLASSKIIFQKPRLFAGQPSETKVDDTKYLNLESNEFELKFAVIFIDGTRVLLKALDLQKDKKFFDSHSSNDFEININGLSWPYSEIYRGEDFDNQDEVFMICIYGLTPLFQYEIDISEKVHGERIYHSVVNTVSANSKKVLYRSPEITPLKTVQSSLISTIDNLNSLKTKYRKVKKDENKKLADLRKEIVNLRNKIQKFKSNNKQGNDSRASGKLKGLKHSVIQLENEIDSLHESLNDSSSIQKSTYNEYKSEETQLVSEIKDLEAFIADYDLTINEYKNKLKLAEQDQQLIIGKNKKLQSKQQMKNQEILKLNSELKNLKKHGINGIHKRKKKVEERFETIMPKLMSAKAQLEKEFVEFSKSEGNN